MKKLTNENFIKKAKLVHGYKYAYSHTHYVKSSQKVKILCKKHGIFKQTPNSHLAGRGCPTCGVLQNTKQRKSNIHEFVSKSNKIYKNLYSYKYSVYKNAITKLIITCSIHGNFQITPNDHLSNQGCPQCAHASRIKKLSKSPENYLQEAKKIHKDGYDYSLTSYKNAYTKVIVICKSHGTFNINPREHLKGYGCPECKPTRASKIAIDWIEEKSKSLRMKNVKHVKNGGEFYIPGTKFRVDGYHENTKTVFEFHGDRWHGNPKVFKPNDKCHPFNNKTAKELYRETIKRENAIKRMGYNLIVQWEHDYRSSKKYK